MKNNVRAKERARRPVSNIHGVQKAKRPTFLQNCLPPRHRAHVHRNKVSKPPCRNCESRKEKSAAALRLSMRLAMCVFPPNQAKTFVNVTLQVSAPLAPERDSGTKEKVRVHLRCFEMKPAIFSMSTLASLPFQRRTQRNNEPS